MALSYHYYYFFLSLVNGTDRYCVHTVALEVYAIPPGVWKARRSARAFGAASVRPSALWLSSAAGGSAGSPSSPLTFTSRRKETLPFSWVPTTPSQSATDPRGASVRHTDATHNVCTHASTDTQTLPQSSLWKIHPGVWRAFSPVRKHRRCMYPKSTFARNLSLPGPCR